MALPCLAFAVQDICAFEAAVAWDPSPSPDVAGYKIHCGSDCVDYTEFTDAGNQTRYTLTNLDAETVYHCSVTAYDYLNNVSDYSNDVVIEVVNAVGTVAELRSAVESANSGGAKTIHLKNGVYTLTGSLDILGEGVVINGLSSDPDGVVIEGNGTDGSVPVCFHVAGSGFALKNVTVRGVSQHGVLLEPGTDGTRFENIRFGDIGGSMIKVSWNADKPYMSSDEGIVKACLFEQTGTGTVSGRSGIEAHNAKNWIVRENAFRSIKDSEGTGGSFAIHFESGSENTLVDSNFVWNCDRGIGFGSGESNHIGGYIINNMIYHDSDNGTNGVAGAGVVLESAQNAQVHFNSIMQQHGYPNAVEYINGSTTGVEITNNLTNRSVQEIDGASGSSAGNITDAKFFWFVDPDDGDLHLQSPIPEVCDRAITIPAVCYDFDGDERPQDSGFDIGADEYPDRRYRAE